MQSCGEPRLRLDTPHPVPLLPPQPLELDDVLFGTRSQTVLVVLRDGRAELRERCLGVAGEWREEHHRFSMAVGTGGAPLG